MALHPLRQCRSWSLFPELGISESRNDMRTNTRFVEDNSLDMTYYKAI